MKNFVIVLMLWLSIANQSQAQKKGFSSLLAEHSFTATDGSSKTLNDIFAAHAGKVIYVDFWATWCAPCVAEMPHSKALKQQLEQDTNIVFIYLSIDDTDEVWKKGLQRLGLDAIGENYRRARADIGPLMRQLYIYSIPHYWIIGKDGKPAELDAMPPSDKKLLKQLAKLSAE